MCSPELRIPELDTDKDSQVEQAPVKVAVNEAAIKEHGIYMGAVVFDLDELTVAKGVFRPSRATRNFASESLRVDLHAL